jgi:phosphoribosylformylglycinamidine synthase
MSKLKFAVLQFPGSNCDRDCEYVVSSVLGHEARLVWHEEHSLAGFDAVILPGGFSYGDYLRSGAMAKLSPIVQELVKFTQDPNKLTIGICNGFQILTEAGLLPGALIRNTNLNFICDTQYVVNTASSKTPFNSKVDRVINAPIAHFDGSYYIDEAGLQDLIKNGQVAFRYCDEKGNITDAANPNGSVYNIAGVYNKAKNVLGMMPHPERNSEAIFGDATGRLIFDSIISFYN